MKKAVDDAVAACDARCDQRSEAQVECLLKTQALEDIADMRAQSGARGFFWRSNGSVNGQGAVSSARRFGLSFVAVAAFAATIGAGMQQAHARDGDGHSRQRLGTCEPTTDSLYVRINGGFAGTIPRTSGECVPGDCARPFAPTPHHRRLRARAGHDQRLQRRRGQLPVGRRARLGASRDLRSGGNESSASSAPAATAAAAPTCAAASSRTTACHLREHRSGELRDGRLRRRRHPQRVRQLHQQGERRPE